MTAPRWRRRCCRPAGATTAASGRSSSARPMPTLMPRRARRSTRSASISACPWSARAAIPIAATEPSPGPPLELLIAPARIRRRVAALARAIDADYRGRSVTLVVVLDGAFIFAADMVRHLTVPVSLAFVRARSYGAATRSSGRVQVSGLAALDLAGRDLILLEDIVDSGLTARTLALCALLHKKNGGASPALARYLGFTVPDRFVVGYGMDYAGRYRNLPGVYALPDR